MTILAVSPVHHKVHKLTHTIVDTLTANTGYYMGSY